MPAETATTTMAAQRVSHTPGLHVPSAYTCALLNFNDKRGVLLGVFASTDKLQLLFG